MTTTQAKIPVGLSTCLAGEPVRYNGSHSRSKLCVETLGQYFEYRTFCPEQAAGFGTPRPTMRLSGDPPNPSLIFSDAKHGSDDLSPQLRKGFQIPLQNMADLDEVNAAIGTDELLALGRRYGTGEESE